MDGLLIVNKPAGITSHDVVNRVRKILGTRKVGHTGTLDPFATGVLVLMVGKATRLSRFLQKAEKEYNALVRLGFATDTGDRTGEKILETHIAHPLSLEPSALIIAMKGFVGDVEQVPPMYSAKKVAGTRLYEHARRGNEVKRKPVKVTIKSLTLKDTSDRWPGSLHDPSGETKDVGISVTCSAGTYIRTLAEDIAKRAGSRAHLAELERTRAGRFSIEQAVTLDELEKMDEPRNALLAVEEAVMHLPVLELMAERVGPTRNGMSTRATNELEDGRKYRLKSPEGDLVAIGEYERKSGSVKPILVLG